MSEPTQRPFEGYFEDFSLGQQYVTAGRTITEADIVNFAGLSGDFNPIHVNAAYAADNPFGQRIAHGLLVMSVASGLTTGLGVIGEMVLAFLGIEWKFRAPVLIGDTVHVRISVGQLKLARRMGGGLVTLEVEVVKQDGEVTQKGSWRVLVKSREIEAVKS